MRGWSAGFRKRWDQNNTRGKRRWILYECWNRIFLEWIGGSSWIVWVRWSTQHIGRQTEFVLQPWRQKLVSQRIWEAPSVTTQKSEVSEKALKEESLLQSNHFVASTGTLNERRLERPAVVGCFLLLSPLSLLTLLFLSLAPLFVLLALLFFIISRSPYVHPYIY